MPNHAASIQLCVQKLRILIEDSDQNREFDIKEYGEKFLCFFFFICSEVFGLVGDVENIENASQKRSSSQRFNPAVSGR